MISVRAIIWLYFEEYRYHGWRWAGLNAGVYQSCENGKFFADEYFDDFYFVLASNPHSIMKIEHPFKDMGSVGEANIINIKNMPAEYQNGIWVMVEHGEDMYGLLFADPNEKKVKLIVANDKPKGEIFTINKDERGYYIEGLFKNYWLDPLYDGDEGDGKQHLEIVYFLSDKNFVIVKYENKKSYSVRWLLGLYDLSRKELLIKDAQDIEEEYDGVNVSYGDYSMLYDYKMRRPLTRPFKNGSRVMNGPLLYSYVDAKTYGSTFEYYIYDDYNKKEHGPFEYVGQCLNNDNLVIVQPFNEPDCRRIFNIDTDNFMTEDRYQYIGPVNPYIATCQLLDDSCYLLDTKRNKKICDIGQKTIVPLCEISPVDSVYLFKTTDEKYNMVSARYGVILPQNVDEIRAFNDNCYVFPIINNGKRFYSMVTEDAKTILPSQQGIPSNFIESEKVYMTYTGIVRYIEISLGIDFGLYMVRYSPEENKILSIINLRPWTTKETDIELNSCFSLIRHKLLNNLRI